MTDPLALVGLVIVLGIIPTFIGIFLRVLNNRNNITKSALNNISLGIMFALFIDFIVVTMASLLPLIP